MTTKSSQKTATHDDSPASFLVCQECGYSLRGIASNRCPECGCDVTRLRSRQSLIPWVRRSELGVFRAYWLTVFWVSFKYKRFCEEVSRDVNYRDAQRFRLITVTLVYLAVMAVTVDWYVRNWPNLFSDRLLNDAFKQIWPMALVHLLVWLYLLAATAAPGYFLDRLDIGIPARNSAIAMSYYTLGALAWTPLNVGILLWVARPKLNQSLLSMGVMLMAISFIALSVLDWWLNLIRTMKRVMPHQPGRAAVAGVLIPILWIVLAGVIFGLIPLIFVYGYMLVIAL